MMAQVQIGRTPGRLLTRGSQAHGLGAVAAAAPKLTANEQTFYNLLKKTNPASAAHYLSSVEFSASPAGKAQVAAVNALVAQGKRPTSASLVTGAKQVVASTNPTGRLPKPAPAVATVPGRVATKPAAAPAVKPPAPAAVAKPAPAVPAAIKPSVHPLQPRAAAAAAPASSSVAAAAVSSATATSWFSGSTTILGYTIGNETLAIGGGVVALGLIWWFMSGSDGKKKKR